MFSGWKWTKWAIKKRLISTKGLTRDLINVCRILKGAKYFFEDGSQNHFLF